MAIISSTGEIARVQDDIHGGSGFHYRNLEVEANPFCEWGKPGGKNGNYPVTQWRFVMSPSIPPKSKITSAFMRGTADAADSGALLTFIRMLTPDGGWELEATLAQWRRMSRSTPPPNAGPKADFQLRVRDTASTILLDFTLTFTGAPWEMRVVADKHDRLGQGFQVSPAGTLGTVEWKLSRVGVPVGDIWCEVYTATNGLPDVLLATSNTRSASLPVTGNGGRFVFTFTGGDQVPLSAGVDYVAVLRGDYPTGGAYVQAQWEGGTGGIPSGHPSVFGIGRGFDDQNYPMDSDFRAGIPSSDSIFWGPPTFVAGVDYDTPSLTGLVQGYVNSPGYSEGDAFGITIEAALFFVANGVSRTFKSFFNATTPKARLFIEFKERSIWVTP